MTHILNPLASLASTPIPRALSSADSTNEARGGRPPYLATISPVEIPSPVKRFFVADPRPLSLRAGEKDLLN